MKSQRLLSVSLRFDVVALVIACGGSGSGSGGGGNNTPIPVVSSISPTTLCQLECADPYGDWIASPTQVKVTISAADLASAGMDALVMRLIVDVRWTSSIDCNRASIANRCGPYHSDDLLIRTTGDLNAFSLGNLQRDTLRYGQ